MPLPSPTIPELGTNVIFQVEDSPGAGTYTEVPGQETTAFDLTRGEDIVTSKSGNGWVERLPTQRDGTVEMTVNRGSPQLDQLVDHINDATNATIGGQVITDSKGNGYVGQWYVLGAPIDAPVDAASRFNFSIVPAPGGLTRLDPTT